MKRAPILLIPAALLFCVACQLGDGARQEQDAGQNGAADASMPPDVSDAKDSGPEAKDSGLEAKDAGVDAGRDASLGQDAGEDSGAGGCVGAAWPTADPSEKGPFAVVTENNVGPAAGIAENGTQPHFVLIRPSDMTQGGFCHPVITWGNGYGDNPPTYMVLLQQLASHGFVVIASLSHYVYQGDPPPMKVGIDWVLQQNQDPTSVLYKHIDTAHVGATGHSAGGLAASQVASDPRVGAVATLCGAGANDSLHGPALLLCGGQDTVATCSGMKTAFDGMPNQPVMLADQLSATHGSWIGSIKDPFMIAVTGWMRLHLMGDTALRKMFYGADCDLCKNTSVWKIQQKDMDP